MRFRSSRRGPASPSIAPRHAFTLVELLVVIGIIAVLISVLLPTLASARRAADKAKCLASLKEIGNAFAMYAGENKGAWPVAAHFYRHAQAPQNRDKRWHDFIAKYVMGNQGVTDKSGKKIITNEMNFNGTVGFDTTGGKYDTHGPFGTDQDPIWIGTLRDRNSVLWGCPSWNKVGSNGTQYEYGANNGYAMSIFPQSPDDLSSAAGSKYGLDMKKVAWIIEPGHNAGGNFDGRYFKASQWKRAAERGLIFDGLHNGGYWTVVANNTSWPYKPDTNVEMPKISDHRLPLDWNRHSKRVGPKPSESTMNMLFCDGHASTLSAREAYRALRFK